MEYRKLVCGPGDTHKFGYAGRLVTAWLESQNMLTPGTDLLDVGCGCGRVARCLIETSIASYTGFDRHPGMIRWSQENITDPRFRFDCFELESIYTIWDQQKGSIDTATFKFPYGANSFDSALLASVFTHMMPEEVSQYFKELARVMRPEGKVLASIFLSPTGVEIHNEINVFHPPQHFLADVQASGFASQLIDPANFELGTWVHHWFRLTRE